MARNRGNLFTRIDAIENRIISPLDRAVNSLTPSERHEYEAYKSRQRIWNSQFKTPDGLYQSYLKGERGAWLPRSLGSKLFPMMQNIDETDSETTLRDKYDEAKRSGC